MLRARQKIGKYRILGRIASGPLADVYRAQDTIQNIKVALKLPKADPNTGEKEILHEVRVATKLRHPNIIKLYSYWWYNNQNLVLFSRISTRI